MSHPSARRHRPLASLLFLALLAQAGALSGQEAKGPPTFTIGGNFFFTGPLNAGTTDLVLQNNGGDDLNIDPFPPMGSSFQFATALVQGAMYNVTVLTNPSNPSYECTVSPNNGVGIVGPMNVTNLTVNCSLANFSIGGTVSGLSGSGLELGGNAGTLAVSANGSFTMPLELPDQTGYTIVVNTQPSSPNQVCSVTNASGTLAGADVTNVGVNCVAGYTVGGSVSGLAGSGLVLQNNLGDDLAISADGSFTFPTALVDAASYSVTVKTQPTNLSQTCVVGDGSGTISSADVTNVSVTCTTDTFTVGGNVSGLSGSGLVLRNNGGDDLAVGADGSFTFATPLTDGTAYAVTVLTQPSSPAQTCSVTDGSDTLAGANVTNVSVDCATTTYTVGGNVTGLSGSGLVLQNNLGDDLAVSANGSFTFPMALIDGAGYDVTVKTQPSSPSQTCAVTSGSGTIATADVTDVSVSCTTNTFTLGGTVSGLAGAGLVLQNNGGDDLAVSADGSFTFATALTDESAYAVSVLTQPSDLAQTCTVTSGSGTLAGANVTSVAVDCTTDTFTVGGNVTGLAGSGLVLQNNAGDDLAIGADGSFTFATPLTDGTTYAVTVLTQPTTPVQTCVVAIGSGTLAGANVTDVLITCGSDTYTVGGSVSGLLGTGLVLQNNGGDDLAIAADGNFDFATALVDGSDFLVTVATQPSNPSQTCSVTNGDSTVKGGDVTDVQVACVTDSFTVGGTVSGLEGMGLLLRNNGGDDLAIGADGSFTFATALADGTGYSVTVGTQPTLPTQTCTVTDGSGTLAGADVTDVQISCAGETYSVGGSVSGLEGTGLVLQNNDGDDLPIAVDGAFVFPTSLGDGATYDVSVLTQPDEPDQVCTVANGAGTLAGADVTDVAVTCVTGALTPQPTDPDPGDRLGSALDAEGAVIAFGVPEADGGGEVLILIAQGEELVEDEVIPIPDGFFAENFGGALVLDLPRLLVGAPPEPIPDRKGIPPLGALQAAMFERAGDQWNLKGTFEAPKGAAGSGFGRSVALDGDLVFIGAPLDFPSGAVYAYEFDGTQVVDERIIRPPEGVAGTGFGASVAADSGKLAVGMPGGQQGGIATGLVQLYGQIGANLGGLTAGPTLTSPNPTDGGEFGRSVALSGPILLVGAPEEDGLEDNAGAAYAYNFVSALAAPSLIGRLVDPEGETGARFGEAVDASDGIFIVGAPEANDGVGRAIQYDPTLQVTAVLAPEQEGVAGFGSSVAASSNILAVGAPTSFGDAGEGFVNVDGELIFRSDFE